MARGHFLARGYRAVSMRSVAADAGVDPALITYFFGSKQGLFGAAMALSANPAQVLAQALPGDLATLPERLVTALVTTWDDAERGGPLRAIVRAAVQEPSVGHLFREVVEREMIERIAERIGGPEASRHAALITLQLSGIIYSRYLLELEPIARMPLDELVRRLAPSMRTLLPRGRH